MPQQTNLFSQMGNAARQKMAPLADRMRPSTLNEILGQEHILAPGKLLRRAIETDRLSSLIFWGPPGTGKTTLARVIAGVNDRPFEQLTAATDGIGDLRKLIAEAEHRLNLYGKQTLLFIDEIHRINRSVEEVLYPAMEDYALDIVMGKGPAARTLRVDLAPFTLIGATTRAGLLAAPLRDRFGAIERLEFYKDADLQRIIERSAHLLNVPITEGGAHELAKRARGTPRIANRLLRRVRDFAQVESDGVITEKLADSTLDILQIDGLGLDQVDRLFLETIILKYGGGPVGLDTLAATINEDSGTLEDMCEPSLLQQGFINRTPRGRMVTPLAYKHLKLHPPGGLFDDGVQADG